MPSTADWNYAACEVPEYWIVDADARIIERWRPESEESEILSTTLLWQPLALEHAFRFA